jgi:hypothetical protein
VVEFYDIIQDPISIFFTEKMQMLLEKKQTLQIVAELNSKCKEYSTKSPERTSNKKILKSSSKKKKGSLKRLKEKRARRMSMNHELLEKAKKATPAKEIIKQFEEETQENDKMVKEGLQEQNSLFERRLQARSNSILI